MVTVCAWCDRFLGPETAVVTHGICPPCAARQHWKDAPVLVVAPHRQTMVPVLQNLLHGVPEVKIVVDRRRRDRRLDESIAPTGEERRSGGDRRRPPDLMLR